MLGKRFKLFTLAGFNVYVDLSWFIIAILVTWSLAENLFNSSREYPELVNQPVIRWAMGVMAAALFFTSIVLHELGHALMARRFDLHIRGITLFIFGGVAEMTDEPPSAKAEFWVAVAGPMVSVLLGVLFLGLALIDQPIPTRAVLTYLGLINLVLVAFNLDPAFPLDGGRILRAMLWAWRDNLRWATRVTSTIGSWFGMLMIAWGFANLIFLHNLIGGLWWVLIGMLLRQAAQMSYQQLLLRRALEGDKVARFMRTDPIIVPPHITIADLVDNYVYVHHHKLCPVAEDGRLLGCITTSRIKDLPREQWGAHTVGELAIPSTPDNTITPDTDAMEALTKMNRTGDSRLMVGDQGQLVGVITLKDLVKFMSLKVELEE